MIDKEQIHEYCLRLLEQICFAKECLSCQNEIAWRITNDERIIHEDFFLLAKRSFLYTGTIILAKAFEDNKKNRPFSIIRILKWTKSCVKLTSQQREIIDFFESEYYSKRETIAALKKQRDSFYAHNDKIDVDALEESYKLTAKDKEYLICFALRVLSFVNCVCTGEVCYSLNDGKTHYKAELIKTLNDLRMYDANKEFLWDAIKQSLKSNSIH